MLAREELRQFTHLRGHTQPCGSAGGCRFAVPAEQRKAHRELGAGGGGSIDASESRRVQRRLGQQPRERAAAAQHLEHAARPRRHQAARQLLPHPLGHQCVDLAFLHQAHEQSRRLRRDAEVRPACGKACQAQEAHRVFGKRR